MKTEPDTFSYDDLLKSPNKTTSWEGVRNYQARNFMRDDFKVGDKVFIYHSNTKPPGIAGIATVVKKAHHDKTALDPDSEYFDEKSKKLGESRWFMVDVKAKKKFKELIPLEVLKETKALSQMLVIQRGQRLSIQPVTKKEWDTVLQLAE